MGSKRVEEEYKSLVDNNSWPQIYQKIAQKCQTYPYTCLEAKKPQNKPLNRYRDVNPFDHTRIILQRSKVDYINANLVQVDRANRHYILTQGPLVFTVDHFWLMVWEQNSRAIIMLNKVIEKNELKCHWYWPQKEGDDANMVLSEVNLLVESTGEIENDNYTTRQFRLTDTETCVSREITQFHYTTWPDFEVPSSPVAFLEFLDHVRASGALDPEVGPAVVHCSAGIGRSGTFCLVDSVLVIIEKEGQANVDIQDILLEMRKHRMGLIQTSEQLRFSYQSIIEGIKRLDPEYKAQKMDESIYSKVADEEEAPPPPPPRGESLGRPPARPLPAIPNSSSLGNLIVNTVDSSTSEDDDDQPTPPPRDTPSPLSICSSFNDETEDKDTIESIAGSSSIASSSSGSGSASAGKAAESLRQRRQRDREMTERIANIKKRSHDAERWHKFKRSLYTPIAFSVGVLVAGILVYAYVKH